MGARRECRTLYPEKEGSDFPLENEHFSLYYHRVAGEKIMTQSSETFAVLTVVAGKGEIRHQGKVYSLQYGDSFFLPACLGSYGKQKQLFPLVRSQVERLINGYLHTKELNNLDNYIVPNSINENQGILGALELAKRASL